MRDLEKYVWIVPYLGIIMCSIALFIPAAYFENVIWNHEIINWIWGYFQDTFNSTVFSGFYENPIQLVPSIIISSIIVACILIIAIGLVQHRKDLKKGTINLINYIIPAICILSSIIFWMIMMEIAERNLYDFSMWDRYVPGFGLVGLFIGAGLIIFGSLIIRLNKTPHIKEKTKSSE